MNTFAKTDIGKAREMNQDCYYIPALDENIKLYIIADGMGGYNGGEVASNLAVFTSKKYIEENIKEDLKTDEIKDLIYKAILNANDAIYAKAKKTQDLEDMGTTLDISLIYNNKLYVGHIGDSRVYLVRKDDMKQLTTDHSYVQKLVKDGTITKEEAYNHPKKNMLLKALGAVENVEPDIMEYDIEVGDIILMCTDGLTNMIGESEIKSIILQDKKNAHIKLIDIANNQGGIDNITVILAENS